MIWRIRNRQLGFSKTLLMGIINLTPDSFSDGGFYQECRRAVGRAEQLVREGADILDLGAESTRPGADAVSSEEELNRLLPALCEIRKKVGVPLSIDTTKPKVARVCLEKGAHIINDVSGLRMSGNGMTEAVREFGAGLVLMHRRGTPKTMQTRTDYVDVVEEVIGELGESMDKALRAGVDHEQIAVDPGIGFSKTAEQCLEIIRNIEKLKVLGRPILLGHSRKSFIGHATGRPVAERVYGTAAVSTAAVLKGVQILRVHDVGAMKDVVAMAENMRKESYVGTF